MRGTWISSRPFHEIGGLLVRVVACAYVRTGTHARTVKGRAEKESGTDRRGSWAEKGQRRVEGGSPLGSEHFEIIT